MDVKRSWMIAVVALVMVAAACGGDDDGAAADAGTTAADAGNPATPATTAAPEAAGTEAPSGGDDEPAPSGGGNGGELVLGDETITFDSARCFLQEQDAAAGGGKILFVVQAFGTNAAGEQIAIDVSRYDEDSQFTGDDIIVDIGDPGSEDTVSLSASGAEGLIEFGDASAAADGVEVSEFGADPVTLSFALSCG